MKTYLFHVAGMHCPSCPVLIESELNDVEEVVHAKASLRHQRVEVTGDFGDKSGENIARDLTEILKSHGYSLMAEIQKHRASWSDFRFALPLALLFVALFVLLQKLGIVNLVTVSSVTTGTAFLIGFIASISTCMAVVGGLVLSMSATFAKEGDSIRPQLLFHVGRLASFFLLGGLIGALGSSFQLGVTGTVVLNSVVGVVLLVLGINLLDLFPWMKKFTVALPGFMGKRVNGMRSMQHTLTPLLVGIATFFLPCGFTQSMQIYALSTGSFWAGATTMFVFALGTLPVLLILSFSSIGMHTKLQSSIFFKTAGLVVIFFAFLTLVSSLTAAGIVPPLFSF